MNDLGLPKPVKKSSIKLKLFNMKILGLSLYHQKLLSLLKRKILDSFPKRLKKILFYGKTHYCPVCESSLRKYEPFGRMAKAWCPVCGSMKWHRLAWLFLQHHTNLFDDTPKKMLHIAPEIAFEQRFKKIANLDYLTGDLFNSRAMVKMDITEIPFPDDSFDIIFCSHVMEHIPNDRQALGEFFRVLTGDGWAIFIVPIRMGKLTDEDLEVKDPKERIRRFGQHDHVRYYGWDFTERLKEAGFQVTLVRSSDVVEENQFEYLGIGKKEVLFYCQKN